jgi:cyclopropane fatty-acyl-phospholipid synthase-like methyltransferase
VRSHIGYLHGIDVDEALIDNCHFPATVHNILEEHYGCNWDAAYALDVMEHVAPDSEATFLRNIARAVKPFGTVIIGMPSRESQPFASRLSRKRHVNCKTEEGLRESLRRYFSNVYLFGMNDATLHTGFGPMCHYRLAICTGAVDRY